MFQFVVSRSLHGDVGDVRRRLLARFLPSLTFRPARVDVVALPHGVVVAAASSDRDGGAVDGGLAVDDGGLLVQVGQPAVEEVGDAAAALLLSRVRREGVDEVRRQLAGHVGLVHVERATGRITAAVDSTGFQPLFTLRAGGVVAVSDRQTLLDVVARDGPGVTFDEVAIADLLWQANLVGEHGAVRDTRHLRPDVWWEVAADGTDHRHPAARDDWAHPLPDAPATWRDVAMEMVTATRVLVQRADEVELSLTGGRDSRLVLGLAIAAGVADRVTAFTIGPPDHPDVVAARRVADVAGVPHVADPGRLRGDDEAIWTALDHHPWRLDASICPWDGLGSAPPGATPRVELAGIGGELTRVNAKRWLTLDLPDDEAVLAGLRDWQQPADPLGVLRPEVRALQDAAVQSWARTELAAGVPRADVEGRLYRQARLPLWSGILNNVRYRRARALPLLHPRAMQAVGRGRFALRRDDVLHGEVLARVSPELYALPLGSAPWNDEVRRRQPSAATVPMELPPHRPDTGGQPSFVRRNIGVLLDLVLSAPSSRLFDVVDRAAFARLAIDGVPLGTVPELKAVLSLAGAQIALTTGGSATYDGPDTPHDLVVRAPVGWEEPLRASWPGAPPAPVLLAARVARDQRRQVEAAVLRDVPTTALAASAAGEPDATLLPEVVFEVPTGALAGLRLDPRREAGTVVVGPLVLETADGAPTTVAWADVTVVNATAAHLDDGRVVLTCDDDPRLVVDDPPATAGRVRLGLAAVDDVVAECYWDDGAGYAESRKDRRDVAAHPLARLLTGSGGVASDAASL